MTWGRMDDKFHRNRKVRELRQSKAGREALGVWVFWWSWCLDDPELLGVIPSVELPSADQKAAKLLVAVGLWDEPKAGEYRIHDFHSYNPTKDQREAKLLADRARVAGRRDASRANVARDSDATKTRVASTRVPMPIPTQPNQEREENLRPAPAEPAAPPVSARIVELESRYRVGVCAAARQACALSRRNGKMSDSVWLTALEALSAHDVANAEGAMETFAARYADGEKDERYLLGICRGNAKGGRTGGNAGQPARLRPSPGTTHLDFADAEPLEVQLQRMREISK